MEAKGHEEILRRAWVGPLRKLLDERYPAAGGADEGDDASMERPFDFYPGAVYLGNWISDMSQFVDKRALGGLIIQADEKIDQAVDFLCAQLDELPSLEELLQLIQDNFPRDRKTFEIAAADDPVKFGLVQGLADSIRRLGLDSIREEIAWHAKTILDQYRKGVRAAIDALEALRGSFPLPEHPEAAMPVLETHVESVAVVLRKVVLLMGYTKFCFDRGGEDQDLFVPYKLYRPIFETLFDQYYTFEHLDRPLLAGKVDAANVGKTRCHVDDCAGVTGRRLYRYLEEGLDLAARQLNRQEAAWAAPTRDGRLDEGQELEWHENLARIGRSLHTLEDFFAHSTFIDHAVVGSARELYNRLQPGEVTKLNLSRIRFDPEHPGTSLAAAMAASGRVELDPQIATGYFDQQDLVISLTHVLVSALGLPGYELDEEIADLTRSTTAAVVDRLIDAASAKLDQAQQLGKYGPQSRVLTESDLRSPGDSRFAFLDTAEVGRLLAGTALEDDEAGILLATAAMDSFLVLLATGRMVHEALAAFSAAREILTLLEILAAYRNPAAMALKLLENLLEPLAQLVLREALADLIRSLEDGPLNRWRIGSHSLLAKDDEFRQKTLYAFAEKTAELVDHSILVHMMRQGQPADEGFLADWRVAIGAWFRHPEKGHPSPVPELGRFAVSERDPLGAWSWRLFLLPPSPIPVPLPVPAAAAWQWIPFRVDRSAASPGPGPSTCPGHPAIEVVTGRPEVEGEILPTVTVDAFRAPPWYLGAFDRRIYLDAARGNLELLDKKTLAGPDRRWSCEGLADAMDTEELLARLKARDVEYRRKVWRVLLEG